MKKMVVRATQRVHTAKQDFSNQGNDDPGTTPNFQKIKN